MNKMVQYMVGLLFRDVEETAEVKALRDEVLANCQAHYDDLIRRGVSTEDALTAVTESLQGMEEVVNQYPRKGTSQGTAEASAEKAAEAEPVEEAKVEEAEEPEETPVVQVTSVELNMKGWDVTIIPSANGRVNVRSDGDGANNIETRFEGDKLTVHEIIAQNDHSSSIEELKKLRWDSFDDMVKGIKTVTHMAVQTVSTAISGMSGELVIEVPAPLNSIHHRSVSGDLKIDGIAVNELQCDTTGGEIDIHTEGRMDQLRAHTTSGDITINAMARIMDLGTLSGDVEITGGCDKVTAATVSGDIDLRTIGVCPSEARLSSTSGDIDADLVMTDIRRLNAHTVSGDVDIVLPELEHSVYADLRTVSGDLKNTIGDAGINAAVQISVQTMSGDITLHNA